MVWVWAARKEVLVGRVDYQEAMEAMADWEAMVVGTAAVEIVEEMPEEQGAMAANRAAMAGKVE